MSTNTTVSYVIAADNVWDGLADASLGPQEILIENGVITDMGTSVAHPAGADVLEFKDHTITPGFIDCHVHTTLLEGVFDAVYTETVSQKTLFSLSALSILLGNGFTTVRDVGCFDPDFITVDLRNYIAQGTVVGPRLLVAPHLLSARSGHGDVTNLVGYQFHPMEFQVADGEAAIIKAVREEIRGGANWIKFAATGGFSTPSDDPSQTTYSQDEMNILVSTALDLGIYCSPHAYGDEGIQRAVTAGVRSIEHGNLATEATLNLMESKGTFIVPTQWTILTKAENANNPDYWKNRSPWQHQKYQKYAPQLIAAAQNLATSNVAIAYGTDAGTFAFQDNVMEFQALVKYGCTPLLALKAATSVAATLLNQSNLGVLAAGKTADIVAMPGDPFKDISVTAHVDFIMKGGIVYAQSIAKLAQLLTTIKQSAGVRLIPPPAGPAATAGG